MEGTLKESLLSGDKKRAIDALIEQLADKLDAGLCSHCGGPRGEAAGMASLNRQLVQLLEMRDEFAENSEEDNLRDDLAKRRLERRRAAAAQSPMATIADSNKQRP